MPRKKIFVMMWISNLPILKRIKDDLDVDLDIANENKLKLDDVESIISRMRAADASIIYRQNTEFMAALEKAIWPYRSECKIVCMARDPSMWGMTSVDHEDAVKCYLYMQASGDENFRRLFRFIDSKILGSGKEILPPEELPYEAVVDLDNDSIYGSTKEYLESKKPDMTRPFVGILASRPAYMMDHLVVEKAYARELREVGLNPILIYCMFSKRSDLGTRSHIECVKDFFYLDGERLVSAVVKFSTAFFGNTQYDKEPDEDTDLLSRMNIPVYQPIVMSRMS